MVRDGRQLPRTLKHHEAQAITSTISSSMLPPFSRPGLHPPRTIPSSMPPPFSRPANIPPPTPQPPGTGSSTPVTRQSLELRHGVGEGLIKTADARLVASYLEKFRSDSIVRDCELVRRELCGEDAKLTLLGQSYGGFCILTYLR